MESIRVALVVLAMGGHADEPVREYPMENLQVCQQKIQYIKLKNNEKAYCQVIRDY